MYIYSDDDDALWEASNGGARITYEIYMGRLNGTHPARSSFADSFVLQQVILVRLSNS